MARKSTIVKNLDPEFPALSRSDRTRAHHASSNAIALLDQALDAVLDPSLPRHVRALALTRFLHAVNGDRGRISADNRKKQRLSTPSVSAQLSQQREVDIAGLTTTDGITPADVADWLEMTEARIGQLAKAGGAPARRRGGATGRPKKGDQVDPATPVAENAEDAEDDQGGLPAPVQAQAA